MPISIRRPSEEKVRQLLARVATQAPTYTPPGATRDPVLPSGSHHGRFSVPLGQGAQTFQRGKDAPRTWQAHSYAGARMTPHQPELTVGVDVVATYRIGIMHLMAPCRIMYVTDTAGSFGFAYGTLPGHAESGEESFHVHMDEAAQVRFEVAFFARLVDPLARVGSPVAWAVQRHVTRRYLKGVTRFVDDR